MYWLLKVRDFHLISCSCAYISLWILFFLKFINDVLDRHWTVFSVSSSAFSNSFSSSLFHWMSLRRWLICIDIMIFTFSEDIEKSHSFEITVHYHCIVIVTRCESLLHPGWLFAVVFATKEATLHCSIRFFRKSWSVIKHTSCDSIWYIGSTASHWLSIWLCRILEISETDRVWTFSLRSSSLIACCSACVWYYTISLFNPSFPTVLTMLFRQLDTIADFYFYFSNCILDLNCHRIVCLHCDFG